MKTLLLTSSLLLAAALSGRAVAQSGYAMRCNGSTDYLQADAHNPTTNNFTMEAWIYPTMPHQIDHEREELFGGMQGQRYVIYPTHGTAAWGQGHAGAGISAGTNGISVYEHAGNYIPAVLTYEAPIEGWTHVAVVYQDATPSLYINGSLVKTGTKSPQQYVHPSGGSSHEKQWKAGGIGGGPFGYFQGLIDNVRIWNAARTTEEIHLIMNRAAVASPLLALNYDMNRTGEGAGLNVANAAGTRLAGTTAGTTATPVFEFIVAAAPASQFRPGLAEDVHHNTGIPAGQENAADHVSGIDAASVSAAAATLELIHPNPFSDAADIAFTIPTGGHVKLALFDAAGREITTLVDEDRAAGRYLAHVDGSMLQSSGTYHYRLIWNNSAITRTMVMAR